MKITTLVNGHPSSMRMTEDQEVLLDLIFTWALRYLAASDAMVAVIEGPEEEKYGRKTINEVKRLHQRYLATTGR